MKRTERIKTIPSKTNMAAVPLLCLEGVKILKSPMPTPRIQTPPRLPPIQSSTMDRFFTDPNTSLNTPLSRPQHCSFKAIPGDK